MQTTIDQRANRRTGHMAAWISCNYHLYKAQTYLLYTSPSTASRDPSIPITMGTRSLICVYYNGKFVIAQYSQWDG